MIRNLKQFWPSLLLLALILWLTLAPHPVGEAHIELFAGADKIVHWCMMFGLTSAILFDWIRGRRTLSARVVVGVALAVTLFSIFDEWAQGAMGQGRTSDQFDLLADIIGVILASLVVPPLLRRCCSTTEAPPLQKNK